MVFKKNLNIDTWKFFGLNKIEFVHFYYELRPNEPKENIDKIVGELFDTLDVDKNGWD